MNGRNGAIFYKEWKLSMSPVPLLFLALSGLLLIPNYPYYVTFFYSSLGIFMFFQSCRENRDVQYMSILPITKREMVFARGKTVLLLEALQAAACVPFMLIRAQYGAVQNAVGIEANVAFLGLAFVLMSVFNAIFLPMHYKNGYDLGKPFLIGSIAEFLVIAALETLEHAALALFPQSAKLLESYALRDQLLQLPVLAAGVLIWWGVSRLSIRRAADRFEKVDL